MAYYCKLALLIIYEPQHAFTLIKRRRARTSLLVPILLLVLCMAVHLARIYITHYPLAASTPEDANLVNELLSLMLPLLSFTVGLYLVTTIRDGETTFRETLTAVAYSMVALYSADPAHRPCQQHHDPGGSRAFSRQADSCAWAW